jgi:hypothetical protein
MTTPVLRLRFSSLPTENKDFEAPVSVSVHFNGRETETYQFSNPIPVEREDGQTEPVFSDLRWYLEEYLSYINDIIMDRARDVEMVLPTWGNLLFDAIFKNPKASRLWEAFEAARRENGGGIVEIDTIEPRVLRLPWELLADDRGYLFSKRPSVQIRRRLHHVHEIEVRDFDLPLHVLVVVSRPKDANFIDPRTIAEPLLHAFDEIGNKVVLEFLRPPTLNALDERLRDTDLPPVHIVHFDGHGVYDSDVGLGFLLFEDDDYKTHKVDAEKLGTLLNESGIPLMVLNACQSAQPDDRNPFGSVASRLIKSGVGGVVAMNYSVLVKTARLLTEHFYGQIARGADVGTALDYARRKLLTNSKKGEIRIEEVGEVPVHLQDWFIPALYQQDVELAPFEKASTITGDDRIPSHRKSIPYQPDRGGFPPAPQHGFYGRSQELLDLDRAFAKWRSIVLHGFGGQGKTALATHAAEWFVKTGLFERAVFISFENGVGLDFVLNEMGNTLVEENFEIHEEDKETSIAQFLKECPTLVVWDNFESVLPNGNAPLKPDDLQALLTHVTQ